MKYSNEIERFLLDCDGSTRDITFTPVPLKNLVNFLSNIMVDYDLSSMSDSEGDLICTNIQAINQALLLPAGYLHGTLNNNKAMISSIDIFIDWNGNSEYAVELSFFPTNINLKCFSLHSFMNEVEEWWRIIDSKKIFMRYENASWKLYDIEGLGVFFYCEMGD